MERTPLLAANWKMHGTRRQAESLLDELLKAIPEPKGEVLICPPAILVESVGKLIAGKGLVSMGVQNLHFAEKGAYTGEISAEMAKDAGCRYAIVGHSERRAMFGETDETCSKKVSQAMAHGLVPVLCVGETLEERENGITTKVIDQQLEGSLAGVTLDSGSRLVVAYEPVWAIGTGRSATAEDAESVMRHIRVRLSERFGERVSSAVRLLYGGSVKPDNIDELMAHPNIDGALVGGASLEAESFARIVNYKVQERA